MAFGQRRLDVVDGVLELVLRRVRRVVRELRLVGAHQVARGIDDGLVEFEDAAGRVAEPVGKFLRLRIEPHAHQRVRRLPGRGQLVRESALT